MKPSIFAKVLAVEAKARMSYRVDFWLSATIGFFAELAVVWFLWSSVFVSTQTSSIAGFNSREIFVYYLAVILISKIVQGVGHTNDTSQDVYQGHLNRYLLFPINYMSFKYAQHLGRMVPGLVQFLLFSIASILLFYNDSNILQSALAIGLGAVSIIIANILFFLIDFTIQLGAFWIDNVWSLRSLELFIATTLGGYMFPIAMFPGILQSIVKALPFRYIYSFPVEALHGKLSISEWLFGTFISILWICLFLLLSQAIWKKGRGKYSGIGI